jgi:hypothetical protein
MVRNPDADRRRIAAEVPRSAETCARQDDRQRARPVAVGQRRGAAVECRDALGVRTRGDEHWELEVAGTPLGLEHASRRRGVVRTRSDPVDGVGRQHDEPAGE